MAGTNQIPSDYKKFLDQVLHKYMPKANEVINTFATIEADSADVQLEYVRKIQTYAAAAGYTSFSTPRQLADGSRPVADGIGTEDATSTAVSYAHSYRIDRKILHSSKPIVQNFIAEHAVEMVDRIRTNTNNTLITNMISNAGQSYSASTTWAAGGDPVADIIDAKAAFKDAAGTQEPDFVILNTNEWADISKDQRFQSTDYTNTRSLETGKITPRPMGLDWIVDPAMTTGSFVMGKKGMFGRAFITENYKTVEVDEGLAGKVHEGVFTFVDQYHLPNYLMAGTGI